MGTFVVTGAASGIGAAVRHRLESDGGRVIGMDLRGAEIDADLSTAAGRAEGVAKARALAGGALAGVVACAGLGPHVTDAAAVASVNFFGATAVLGGLCDALVAGGAAVAVASNAATLSVDSDNAVAAACLDDDEAAARRHATELGGQPTYGA